MTAKMREKRLIYCYWIWLAVMRDQMLEATELDGWCKSAYLMAQVWFEDASKVRLFAKYVRATAEAFDAVQLSEAFDGYVNALADGAKKGDAAGKAKVRYERGELKF